VWTLETGKAAYVLHFGNWAYLAGTGMPLEKGKAVTVEGACSKTTSSSSPRTWRGRPTLSATRTAFPLAKYDPARRGPATAIGDAAGESRDCGWGGGMRGGEGSAAAMAGVERPLRLLPSMAGEVKTESCGGSRGWR